MGLRFRVQGLMVALAACSMGAMAQGAATKEAVSATAPANPDGAGSYHIGDGVSEPQLIYSVNPEFAPKSVRRSFSGSCAVEFTIDTKGQPQNIRVVQSMGAGKSQKLQAEAAELDRNAVSAVKQYRFLPAMFQGKAVPVTVKLEVDLSVI